MDFLRQLNTAVRERTNGYLIGEDSSTEWGITSTEEGNALGFMLKWNMGCMNDTLRYIEKDPIYRQFHHETLVHTVDYAFSENFVLVLSHDEVVYGKKSLIEKSPGGVEEKYGCMKALLTHQIGHPGKKLLFMGQDFAQNAEWSVTDSIDWHLADDFGHRDIMLTVRKLLEIYRTFPVLYSDSRDPSTFEWVNRNDFWRNTISYIRRNPWNYEGALLFICNFSPMGIGNYACGVPLPGTYRRVFSTYDTLPGGGGPEEINAPIEYAATKEECDGRDYRITFNMRPYESIIVALPA
jgi:1,4-alpha-glucan branching enzyme